jgi:CRISPR-associated protein Csx14
VSGLNPQVITETLYALHQNGKPVDAVHVITTRDGREKINAHLLAGASGHYYRYLKAYGISPDTIDFGYHTIHTIRDEYGNEIPDITDEYSNERLLKLCLELTFEFTRLIDTTVYFSVAGGRKTMSACLTLAAQMYARSRDRIFHVLVSPEFESNRDFYYPPQKSRSIRLMDQRGQPFYKETRYARINLIHLPFVSIRERLPGNLLENPQDPGTLLLSLVREDVAVLTVNLIKRKIIYKTHELDMPPAWMALYAFFIFQKKSCTKNVSSCGDCSDCFQDLPSILERQNEITAFYHRLCKTRPVEEMSDTGIINLTPENFNSYKGKIKSHLRKRFGPYALPFLEISARGTRPNTCYGIQMDKKNIEFVY